METPDTPTPVHKRIREGLSRVATAMRTDDWAKAKATGLNPTQYAILEYLEDRKIGSGVKDIAFYLGVSQPTATDSITALERKNLVVKTTVEKDKRAVQLSLTQEGRAALETGNAVKGVSGQAMEALSESEQEDLLVTLVKIIRHLQEANAIPIQRMCASCCYFRPFAHSDTAKPHHCDFVDAAFGQKELRIDCRDHMAADPAVRADTWDTFQRG